MKIDEDIVQRIKVVGIFGLQFYKVLTGTMLSLFVPQACYDTGGSTLQVCSLTQNLENEDIYHRLTLYWNGLSFMCFTLCYLVELRRENWAIKFLDINNDLPDNSLKGIIVTEPKLDKQMDSLNRIYFRGLLITGLVYFINVCLMVNILMKDYHSGSTTSCFISFVLLVQMKLYNSLTVAYQSVKNDKMMSAYMSEFVSYNVLDADYVATPELLRP
jgi:hypothetical protein|tara:strand:+ start:2326 stop:2973 length:648 start_codon:yes stop_codon:yes gene_type:complete